MHLLFYFFSHLFINVLEQVLDIYDSSAGMLRIGPFNYDPIRGVDLWLAQSDEFLLTHLSTSPEVEPPHFTSQVGAFVRFGNQQPVKHAHLNRICIYHC